ncbi:MAG: hypothetical protein RL885_33075 [Planctomycetota bacterium]
MATRSSGFGIRHPLSFLLIFVVILVALNFLFPSGVGADVKERYQRFQSSLAKTQQEGERALSKVDDLMERDPEFLRRYDLKEGWTRSLEDSMQSLDEARRLNEQKLEPLIVRDDADDEALILQELGAAEKDLQQASVAIAQVPGAMEKILEYKSEAPRRLETVKREIVSRAGELAGSEAELEELRSEVASAEEKYPAKKADLDKRLSAIDQAPEAIEAWAKEAEAELQKETPDYLVAVGRIRAIEEKAAALRQAPASLRDRLKQLDTSRDKILTDMEVGRGAASHRHEYKIIEQVGDQEPTTRSEWQNVSASVFERHRNHLGMTLESKPKGLYDEEAQQLAAPPGYNYVGNPHYGRWESRNGSSFWVFYGQYRLMNDLFWGGSRNISRSDWNNYDTHRRQGKTYYGQNVEYGSKGSITKTRYKDSKYVKNDGYRGSQYQKQSYSSSRYGSGSNRSSGVSRSRSSSRSFSFSGGGK